MSNVSTPPKLSISFNLMVAILGKSGFHNPDLTLKIAMTSPNPENVLSMLLGFFKEPELTPKVTLKDGTIGTLVSYEPLATNEVTYTHRPRKQETVYGTKGFAASNQSVIQTLLDSPELGSVVEVDGQHYSRSQEALEAAGFERKDYNHMPTGPILDPQSRTMPAAEWMQLVPIED